MKKTYKEGLLAKSLCLEEAYWGTYHYFYFKIIERKEDNKSFQDVKYHKKLK